MTLKCLAFPVQLLAFELWIFFLFLQLHTYMQYTVVIFNPQPFMASPQPLALLLLTSP